MNATALACICSCCASAAADAADGVIHDFIRRYNAFHGPSRVLKLTIPGTESPPSLREKYIRKNIISQATPLASVILYVCY